MKRKTVIFLIVLVACGMAGSYLTRLIISVRGSRMTMVDKWLLRNWVDLVRAYPEMQELPSRADAARNWARTAADRYSKIPRIFRAATSRIGADDCPPGLTPSQAELIRSFVWSGLYSGRWETRERREVRWRDVLTGPYPQWDKKPSECLTPNFLDQYPREPLEHETWYRLGFLRPEEVIANRDALLQLANDHALLELIDQCWQMGYEAGSPRPSTTVSVLH